MGAPLGNQFAAKAKRWEAAIIRAVEAWPNKPDTTGCNALMIGLNEAAHAFVGKMMDEKDLGFFKEFGDRLEGKAAQGLEISNKEGEEFKTVTKVELVAMGANAVRKD